MYPIKKLSHTPQNLAYFMHVPVRYDHSKFILKYFFSLHMFNKLAITLSMNITKPFCLEFALNSLLDDI